MKQLDSDKYRLYFESGIDIENRRIFLIEGITEESSILIIQALLLLEKLGHDKEITFYIGSFGGEIYEMFAIYDVLSNLTCPVKTIAIGKCMSAAPLLVAAGTHGNRFAMPNTWFMCHQGWSDGEQGKHTELKAAAQHSEELHDRWVTLLESNTNKDAKFWKKIVFQAQDTYFDAQKAKEYGIIDEIYYE